MAVLTNMPPQAYTRDTLVRAIDWLSRQPNAVKERANTADLIVSHFLQANRRSDLHNETPISGEAFREDLKSLARGLKQFEEPSAPPPIFEPSVRRETPATPVPRSSSNVPGQSSSTSSYQAPYNTFSRGPSAVAKSNPTSDSSPAPVQAPSPAAVTPIHAQSYQPPPAQNPQPMQPARPNVSAATPLYPALTPLATTASAEPNATPKATMHTQAPGSQTAAFTWTPDARSLTVARELQERMNLSSEGEALRMLITLGRERARDLFP